MSDLDHIVITPNTTVWQIALMCQKYSTADSEVCARVESVKGRPVAFLVRHRVDESVPMLLRRQAE